MLKEKLSLSKEPVFLIDGSSFLYRAFYAFPDLKRSDGFPTNAIFIVLRILIRLLREERPRYGAFFLDGKGPTFRNEIYDQYKAQRPKMPEDLAVQVKPLLEAVQLLGFRTFVSNGVEADDLIAGQASVLKNRHPVVIVASDKDLRQLLDDRVFLWDPGGKKEVLMTVEDFRRQTGLEPFQWPDFQALVGDSSDNIPGVPGIGPKTAASLLADHPTLEDLKHGFDQLAARDQKKLQDHLEVIFTYRQLTRLRLDCQNDVQASDLEIEKADHQKLLEFLQKYEFRSLARDLAGSVPKKERQLSFMSGMSGQKKRVSRQSGFPDMENLDQIGLYPVDQGFLLGAGDQEWEIQTGPEKMRKRLSGIRIYVFSLKDLARLDRAWIDPESKDFFDISLAAYLLNTEAREYDFEHIYRAYSREVDVPRENKGLAALLIGTLLDERLRSAGLDRLMQDLEMPLIPVLVRMESRGIGIDLEAFADFLGQVRQRLKELTKEIFSLAGKEFNIRSTQQTAEVLFDDLKLKTGRKTPGGAYSTSNTVLEAMRREHPVVGLILEYRTLEKLRSTYLEPLPGKVKADGRLHTTFNQLATATGRLSSSNPNLQNIPIRGEFGPRMRACFVPSADRVLVAADYSQIELRILAHMSGDPNLLDAFARGEDIHTRTAGLLFDQDISSVTPDQRRKAKTINFGLLYGMGPLKLSRELSISMEEAKEFIRIYFSKLGRVREFYDHIESLAKEKGYVTTIAGRRRLVPDINSRNANLAQQARRMAINTVVQGSAADIIKKAMLAVDMDQELAELGAELILQVHDELLIEVPEAGAKKAGQRLALIMSQVEKFDIPLAVEWGAGVNWAEAHQ
ncbi:DNA polymerase I [Desulfonatronovibrio hydrogenovorans]|uniref:DNA polymerase I n=1 Tax=Desulfonatronovibrio hydrogenovorans TaxID=53245 RepID=UPI00048CD263|nr:DNA polymerase I [Desulfonatronovibrio hydrogenovorans]